MNETSSDGRPGTRFAVGTRVRTRHSVDRDVAPDDRPVTSGAIVDEFDDAGRLSDDEYGRDWAVTKRWAVALDDGPLVFRDDEELELDES
ncbi:hypothetical protein DW322_21205 [Rhodococcus rhodnii]|nr:hypothetical protein [Rhodococcus rhodnii]TXG92218.1 hypothetical protein DW322_21205 [Rhodococcus rhodnii]